MQLNCKFHENDKGWLISMYGTLSGGTPHAAVTHVMHHSAPLID